MHNPSIGALIVSEISAFIRTDGKTDMARSTRLVILIRNKYTLCGRIRLVPTYILLAKERRLLGKFYPDSFKTEKLVGVETDGHGHG